ncbi:MAG: YihA family ribosome biogenesis GTP-binding protein [Nitratiruptor sp.]|nr:YihA family ribosome biogenesis GTP-binding protein [Nitratiruptor sp.]NPA84147.1 YihA family ribosome biogenesis GTP-binding protein [Campylobacterota bacterium]
MQPVQAKFLTSAPSIRQAPPASLSEVAFLGRSNVGKSSLINALTGRKGLAKSSATPGKTSLINFFDVLYRIGEEGYPVRFVDLPGYGYAKRSKRLQEEWGRKLTEFLAKRDAIRVFVHLRDARHFDLPIDQQTKEFLEQIKRGDQLILEVFTKADKLKQRERAALRRAYPEALLVSATKGQGIDALRQAILEHLFGANILPQSETR